MDAAVGQLPDAWSQVRAPLIVPLLRLSVAVCLGMAVLLFLERLYMGVVIVGVKLLRRTPERRYKCDPISEEEDPELGSAAFPSVLVQIPMFNEREVHSTFHRPPIGICRARPSFSSSIWFPFGHWFSQSCTEVQGWVNVIINYDSLCIRVGVSAVDRRSVRAVVAVGSAGGAGAGRLHGPHHQGEKYYLLSPSQSLSPLHSTTGSTMSSSSTGLVIMEPHVHLSVTLLQSTHPLRCSRDSLLPKGKSRNAGASCCARPRPPFVF
jgi:hypothetical protein